MQHDLLDYFHRPGFFSFFFWLVPKIRSDLESISRPSLFTDVILTDCNLLVMNIIPTWVIVTIWVNFPETQTCIIVTLTVEIRLVLILCLNSLCNPTVYWNWYFLFVFFPFQAVYKNWLCWITFDLTISTSLFSSSLFICTVRNWYFFFVFCPFQAAYKNWLCGITFDFYAEGRHIKPCLAFCYETSRKCPFLLPSIQYCGTQAYFCPRKFEFWYLFKLRVW